MHRAIFWLILIMMTACSSQPVVQSTATTIIPSAAPTQSAIPSLTSTPQSRLSLIPFGPEPEEFPADVNPLTGLAVQDSSLLTLPAVLVSISNMPFSARPQAGPGFAPWVYEFYIGEGATRFMNVFY